MNPNLIQNAHRSLYGELTGMLRGAWRRSAEQAQRQARAGAAPMLAALALAAGVPLALAGAAMAQAASPAAIDECHTANARQQERHALAMQSYLDGRRAEAFGRFAELADENHGPSALMALTMVRHGAWMFGSEWSATPGQLQRWSALALMDLGGHSVTIAQHDRGE